MVLFLLPKICRKVISYSLHGLSLWPGFSSEAVLSRCWVSTVIPGDIFNLQNVPCKRFISSYCLMACVSVASSVSSNCVISSTFAYLPVTTVSLLDSWKYVFSNGMKNVINFLAIFVKIYYECIKDLETCHHHHVHNGPSGSNDVV